MSQNSALFSELMSDLHPPLTAHEAGVESDRCYFCYDAPCVTACPTGIDVPLFIRQIQTNNPAGAAQTIFDENILGGMCARVCPTETLCEQACVRNTAEHKPVKIGALQRFATDTVMNTGNHPYQRAAESGRHIAVIGAGPAGLSCAHRLALHGHKVTIMDANPKPGGLNEYGIASYKTPNNFAQQEVDFILDIGGIEIKNDTRLGQEVQLDKLLAQFDAVFIGVGLKDTNAISLDGESLEGVEDAVSFIAELRQTEDYAALDIGRRVVVIGGGMTAIDAAVQSKLLGAEEVTLVYRRDKESMNASVFEQDLAQTNGVKIIHHAQPVRFIGDDTGLTAVEFEYTQQVNGKLDGTGETFTLAADHAFNAIGQTLEAGAIDENTVALKDSRIVVNQERKTSHQKIWAGGDCIAGGDDLTVSAVQDGKIAAESIHHYLAPQN